ncbi:MAG TPA: class I SAM-dependent methyltransferase [Actinomycetota bacterium]|nr:class I SAM-dependent methyltransferase [Actinomycetota bacterium]
MDDAFGTMLLDALEGRGEGHEIVERDDGYVKAATMEYFGPIGRWSAVERRALRFVRGRVLDVGCGAGRVALELQTRGHEVVAIDPSPGAVDVSRRRGVRDVRQMGLEDVDASLGHFETVLMYGNNFGLFGARMKARRLLTGLRPLADRIVAASNDPYATDDPVHLTYGQRNRRRHRMPGQARLRVRYHDLAGPWFDYLLVSPAEMQQLVGGTGWRIDRLVRDDGSYYVAVLV